MKMRLVTSQVSGLDFGPLDVAAQAHKVGVVNWEMGQSQRNGRKQGKDKRRNRELTQNNNNNNNK